MPDEKPQGEGKCALVTGGSRGIGKGICEVLASHGYDIATTYASAKDEGEETKTIIEATGRRCFLYHAELQNAEVPQQICEQAIKDLGRVDVLVNNAGQTRHNRISQTTVEQIDYLYGLNFRAGMMCMAVISKHMIDNGIQGNIINIASTRGIRSYPTDSIYGGLKAALIRVTESAALELSGHGIRVNCIAPGMTMVRGSYDEQSLRSGWMAKIPLRRAGTPAEVGHLAAYLCSEKAAYITGDTIKIDGGLILPGMPEDGSPEAGYGWGITGD